MTTTDETKDYRLQVTDDRHCRLQTLQATDTIDDRQQTTTYRLQMTDDRLQMTDDRRD